ncbi:DUF736 family protein [Sphingobium lactosutens]|uniref:Uncharacterized protein n=1 Tax=Sphingobium lactosutens DS20 TaxID=1331060 RepID=T0IS16_9SPHN|nr:DUF736 family protein [Sphingobium lactosutens]EQB12464.1 hypothetical protein RLDS_20230 [Sphingobium lactosutens DS20]EQB18207.1 hypothetical protein RLDS_02890 [Sphingobium lactosutens DS20]
MRRYIVIGRLKHSFQRGWEGKINTLTLRRQIRLVPNDDRGSSHAPASRITLGWQHIEKAWESETCKQPSRTYLHLPIEDPHCPLDAFLFPDADADCASLIMDCGRKAPSGHPTREDSDG